ncbi:antibiotic biosynthesis monooxygenase family protein [Tepidamorphus sp. 3E244]|uniref:antibiotic biosynthesis monooxygenase family protein n=1 Tax=Tepidamorphus sp. 3E244 TaxID=3385498 RepID=UPI0038FCF7AB
MIAIIFEVEPHEGHAGAYFDLAGELKPLLADFDGFISVERFEAVLTPGRYLSLSFWRDEESVQRWRKVAEHRLAQTAGRNKHFAKYRIRVAQVLRDYTMDDREQAPEDLRAVHG